MRDYLADHPGDRHGKFKYSTQLLIDIGEDLHALHAEFAPFRDRFGVPIEIRVEAMTAHPDCPYTASPSTARPCPISRRNGPRSACPG